MDANRQTKADDESVPDDDHRDDLEHRLDGTTAALAGMEVLAAPEDDARVEVGTIPEDAEGPDAVATLGIYSDAVRGRAVLDPEEARRIADQLAATADRVEAARRGE